jgi:hypothetical protein
MNVAAADPGGRDGHHDLTGTRFGLGQIDRLQGIAVADDLKSAHRSRHYGAAGGRG